LTNRTHDGLDLLFIPEKNQTVGIKVGFSNFHQGFDSTKLIIDEVEERHHNVTWTYSFVRKRSGSQLEKYLSLYKAFIPLALGSTHLQLHSSPCAVQGMWLVKCSSHLESVDRFSLQLLLSCLLSRPLAILSFSWLINRENGGLQVQTLYTHEKHKNPLFSLLGYKRICLSP